HRLMAEKRKKGAIGLRVKTGRAIAVVLRAPADAPSILKRVDLMLVDASDRDTWMPYHKTLELPWPEADAAVRKHAGVIAKEARTAIAQLVDQSQAAGIRIAAASIVGGSPNDPARIGNPHVRAHAAEGRLFPELSEKAALACGLRARWFTEREFEKRAADELALPANVIAARLSELGRAIGRPWRSDEKLAALAAWVALKRP